MRAGRSQEGVRHVEGHRVVGHPRHLEGQQRHKDYLSREINETFGYVTPELEAHLYG